jgi:hypothetical protein
MNNHIWSLLDMLKLNASYFGSIVFTLVNSEMMAAGKQGRLPQQIKDSLALGAAHISDFCEKLELRVSASAAKQLAHIETSEQMAFELPHLRNIMFTEIDARTYYGPLTQYAKYFENPKLFGDDVFSAFPSATDDITEAGTCLALERSTACVMHLMRVAEVGLKALAAKVGVIRQNDWGAYIRKIDEELVSRMKALGKHTPDEAFYAEASAQFGHVKTYIPHIADII